MRRTIVGFVALAAFGMAALAQIAGAQQWGTIKGKILYGAKKAPVPVKITSVDKNVDKAFCLKDGKIYAEHWVVNPKNLGLKWTFVWLAPEDPKSKEPLPIHPDLKEIKQIEVVMDQPVCMFIPHAIAMRQGQILVAKNSAKVAHNFKWTGDPTTPNAGLNKLINAGDSFPIKGLVADRLPIKIECNIHPWMNGWVRVYNHPYYAVTDADGSFEIKDAPVGNHRLIVWHGSGGWLGGAAGKNGKNITIKADPNDLGSMDYPPPAE